MRVILALLMVGCANNMILDDVEPDGNFPKDSSSDAKFDAKPQDAAMEAIADVATDTPDDAAPDSGGCVDDTRSPTTAMDVSSIGTRAWSNPTNALTSNGQFANVSAMINQEISHYLQVGGYGFQVPNNMKIMGVTLAIQRNSLSAVGLIDHRVLLVKNGNLGATDKSVGGTWITTLGIYMYGGMNDLWNETLTPADVNAANFGAALAVRYNNQAGNDWPYVDHMEITVRYCPLSLAELRAHAIAHTLFEPTTLGAAIARLGFVQADPIRAPARAQDLILRHRVTGYRAGDLEKAYATLEVEEDLLYAYGFLPRAVWQLLHPRKTRSTTALEKRVLAIVGERGTVHPRDLESQLGKKRVVNAWGGFSKATTHALDRLQLRGHLRVARRDSGIRVYALAPEHDLELSPQDRVNAIALVVASLLAPVRRRTLQSIMARASRWIGAPRPNVRALGLEAATIEGEEWLWPAAPELEPNESVRILAPFDPIVWDRARFEKLWGWNYRFEAYTPIKKRVRGYYAMPLVWRDRVIGWANASANGDVDLGFASKRPRDRSFTTELDAEIDRFRVFLDANRKSRSSRR